MYHPQMHKINKKKYGQEYTLARTFLTHREPSNIYVPGTITSTPRLFLG